MCQYHVAQIKRIIDKAEEKGDNHIRLKVECDTAPNQSHWLNVPLEQAMRIQAILATIPE